MKTITGNEIKLLPEMLYDAILDYDEENGLLKDRIFFSKNDIPNEAQQLCVYNDISTKLLMTQCPNLEMLFVRAIREKLYNDMWYIDYEDKREDGRPTIKYHDWYYTFYDDVDLRVDYHREKNKMTGEDMDYFRIICTFVVKIDKVE